MEQITEALMVEELINKNENLVEAIVESDENAGAAMSVEEFKQWLAQ